MRITVDILAKSFLATMLVFLPVLAMAADAEVVKKAEVPAVSYTITNLGTLGGRGSTANAINNAGQIVGFAETNQPFPPPPTGPGRVPITRAMQVADAFLYSDGKMQDLGTLGGEGDAGSVGNAINASGQVVGWAKTSANAEHAFIYGNGKMQDLGISSKIVSANAINAHGDVVGFWMTGMVGGNGPEITFVQAFLCSGGKTQMVGTLGGNTSRANGINDAGQIVGSASLSNGESHAFLYSNGKMQDLGTFGGKESEATAINAKGQVAGWAHTPNNFRHAFLFHDGKMEDIGTLGSKNSWALAINLSGQVVGFSENASDEDHAFLYQDGKMQDLNVVVGAERLASVEIKVLAYATSLNDRGQIVGYAKDTRGNRIAFLLTPISGATPSSSPPINSTKQPTAP